MKTVMAAAFLLTTAAIGCPPALLAASEHQTASLRGIRSMSVVVEEIKPGISGLTEKAIQTDVELKLRMTGVKVDSSAKTYLYVQVTWLSTHMGGRHVGYGYYVQVKFEQGVTALETGWQGIASTWGSGSIGSSPTEGAGRRIRRTVKENVDEFLNDYLSVNPRQPSQ